MEGQYRAEAERVAESCINDFLALLDRTDWQSLGERDGVRGFQMTIDGRNTIKSIGVINFPPEAVCQYILDNSQKKNWDKMLIESKVLHDYGNVRVVQESFSAPWPVSGRDFVFAVKYFNREKDIVMVARSIEIGVPHQRGVVRGEIVTSGFYLKKLEDNNTEITYSVCLDLKGMIPNMLVNQMAKNQVGNVNKIRRAMGNRGA